MSWIINIILVLLGGLTYRIRGGMDIPFTDKEFPLNKWWFAAYVCFLSWYLYGLDYHYMITAFIAGKLCTSCVGWGRYRGAIYYGWINWDDKDSLAINDIIDNLHITFKGHEVWLKDYPRAYGVVGMTLRGGLLTCIIGLCFHSLLLMALGLIFGLVDYGCYWLNKIIDDKARGWNWSEFFEGCILTGGILATSCILTI